MCLKANKTIGKLTQLAFGPFPPPPMLSLLLFSMFSDCDNLCIVKFLVTHCSSTLNYLILCIILIDCALILNISSCCLWYYVERRKPFLLCSLSCHYTLLLFLCQQPWQDYGINSIKYCQQIQNSISFHAFFSTSFSPWLSELQTFSHSVIYIYISVTVPSMSFLWYPIFSFVRTDRIVNASSLFHHNSMTSNHQH